MKTDFEIQLEQQARKWFDRKNRDKYYGFKGTFRKPFFGTEVQYLDLTDTDVLYIKNVVVNIYNNEFGGDNILESINEVLKVIDFFEFKGKDSVLDMLVFDYFDTWEFSVESVDLDTVHYMCNMSYIPYDKNKKTILEPESFMVALTYEEYICMMVSHMMSGAGMNYLFMMNPKLGQKILQELWDNCYGQPSLIICDEIETEVASLLEDSCKM